MSTTELKEQIIQSLKEANDIDAIQHVQKLMDELKKELYKDILKPLTVEEYDAKIQAGLDSLKAGRVYTEIEAKKKLDAIMGR